MGKQKILDDCDMKGQGDLESEDGKARVSSSFLDRRGGGETVREDANEGKKKKEETKDDEDDDKSLTFLPSNVNGSEHKFCIANFEF